MITRVTFPNWKDCSGTKDICDISLEGKYTLLVQTELVQSTKYKVLIATLFWTLNNIADLCLPKASS